MQWWLYVDEAGRFEDADDAVVVGGVLVAAGPNLESPEVLKARWQATAPCVPWPLHAALINHAAYLLLCADVHATRTGVALDADAADAMGILEREHPESVRHIRRAIEWGAKVRDGHLASLERALQALAPAVHDRFCDLARQIRAQVGRSVRNLRPEDGPIPLLFICGETQLADAYVDGARYREDVRYFALLEELFGRVMDTLERRAGEHDVGVQVLGRGVEYRGWPGSGRELSAHDVRQLIDRTSARRRRCLVTLRLDRIAFFDGAVEPPFILADFLSNGGRRITRKNHRATLGKIEGGLQALLSGHARTGHVRRTSHCAAFGLAADWVDWALGRSVARPSLELKDDPPRRVWACEQARQWIALRGVTV